MTDEATPRKIKSSQPPVTYEARVQVTGVSRRYNFPGGLTPEQFDLVAADLLLPHEDTGPDMMGTLKNTFNKLAALNPGAESLAHDNNPRYLRHAIFGMASSMNLDDIRFFIEQCKYTNDGPVAVLAHRDPNYDHLYNMVETRTGVSTNWVASPATLMHIYEQVSTRPPVHPIKTPPEWRPPGARGNRFTPYI
jgi:hypothetical protein